MSFAYLSQYDEAFPCKNSDESVYPKEQAFDVELKKSIRKENFWHLLRKKIASVLSLLQNRSPRSSGSNRFQQTSEVLALSSPVESCPDMSLIAAFSSAYVSRVNFNLPSQKLNLNNFLMFLLVIFSIVFAASTTDNYITLLFTADLTLGYQHLCSTDFSNFDLKNKNFSHYTRDGNSRKNLAFTFVVVLAFTLIYVNVDIYLTRLQCSCIPVGSVPPPTKIMVCLPCPPPASPATFDFLNKRCESYPFCVPRKLDECHAQASRKGKYLPPPERRRCSERCLHVSDLKAARPCMAVQGSPCVAHCYETHRKCSST